MLHDFGIQVNGSFVLGFDHDHKDVFARTAEWVEENRLECATFHILTPYPATPLFRRMEAEERLLHRDWTLSDTAHAVFRPKHMTPEELRARLCVDLPTPVLACFDLAAAAGRLACCAFVPCDVLLVQALKLALASTYQARACAHCVVAARASDALTSCAVPTDAA
jgi:hypothetical protein